METESNPADTAYAEYAALVDLFGDHPKTKILATLLSQSQDINISQISELAGTSRSTVYEHIDDLIEIGVIEKTRKINGGYLYQINRNNDTAQLLAQTEWELLDHYDGNEQANPQNA